MNKIFFFCIFSIALWWLVGENAQAQSEDNPKPQQEVGEHDDSKSLQNNEDKGGSGKKRKKKKKNLDALVEGKTQEDLEESNKPTLTKEEKDYLKKVDDLTRKRTEKIIAKRQKKAKKKVTKSKKNYLNTH